MNREAMKAENPSRDGSSKGPPASPRDEDEGVVADNPNPSYNKADVNTFLDKVLSATGSDNDNDNDGAGAIKDLAQLLKTACAKIDLVQLVRGGLHLVELYQAGKRKRSRSRTTVRGDSGVVPQRGNTLVDVISISLEDNAEADHQGQPEENEGLKDLKPATISKQENKPLSQEDEEELPSEEDGEEQGNEDSPNVNVVNAIEEEEERCSNGRPLPDPDFLLIPEDESSESDSSGLDPSYPEGSKKAFKRKKRNRKPFQKNKNPLENGGEDSSSSNESDVSQDENSSSEDPSRNDQEFMKRQKMGLWNPPQKKEKPSNSLAALSGSLQVNNDEANAENAEGRSSSSCLPRPKGMPVLIPEMPQDPSTLHPYREKATALEWKTGVLKPFQKKNKASEDLPNTGVEQSSSSIENDVSPQKELPTKDPKRTHKCLVCMKMLSSKDHLKVHSRVHTNERPFPCPRPNCLKKYKTKQQLDLHLLAHGGAKPFKCPYPGCKKAFAYPSGLEAHNPVHAGELPFKCKQPGCSKKFALKSRLRTHEGSHTRPFKCPFQGCGMAFATNADLQRHQRRRRHN